MAKKDQTFADYTSDDLTENKPETEEKPETETKKTKKESKRASLPRFGKFKKGK